MCLTIPKRVLSVSKKGILIESINNSDGQVQNVSSIIKIKKGDIVLTQGGIITTKITANQLNEINKIINSYKK